MQQEVNLILVRHGQDEDNANNILNGHRDKPLTILGRKQAKLVAKKLQDDNINIIYSSPLKRARETAEIITKQLKSSLKVRIHPNLIERNFGVLTGKPVKNISLYSKKLLKTDRVTYFLEAEGVENFSTLFERAASLVNQMRKMHKGKNVLLVTHGDVGKMVRAVYHGWNWKKGLMTPYFDNTEILKLGQKDVEE